MRIENIRVRLLLVLTLLCICAGQTEESKSLAPASFDFKALLGEPPADGSDVQKQEIATMLKLQANRTKQEVARCQAEEEQGPYDFGASVVGAWFTGKNRPLTNALFIQATRDAKDITGAAKLMFRRNRPYVTDPEIKPCAEKEKTFSYPSGHATRGILWATILAELFPDHRDALLAHGRQYGTDRTLAGVHYPSDVVAGQKLGEEIANRLLADPDFAGRVAKAKQECAAAHP